MPIFRGFGGGNGVQQVIPPVALPPIQPSYIGRSFSPTLNPMQQMRMQMMQENAGKGKGQELEEYVRKEAINNVLTKLASNQEFIQEARQIKALPASMRPERYKSLRKKFIDPITALENPKYVNSNIIYNAVVKPWEESALQEHEEKTKDPYSAIVPSIQKGAYSLWGAIKHFLPGFSAEQIAKEQAEFAKKINSQNPYLKYQEERAQAGESLWDRTNGLGGFLNLIGEQLPTLAAFLVPGGAAAQGARALGYGAQAARAGFLGGALGGFGLGSSMSDVDYAGRALADPSLSDEQKQVVLNNMATRIPNAFVGGLAGALAPNAAPILGRLPIGRNIVSSLNNAQGPIANRLAGAINTGLGMGALTLGQVPATNLTYQMASNPYKPEALQQHDIFQGLGDSLLSSLITGALLGGMTGYRPVTINSRESQVQAPPQAQAQANIPSRVPPTTYEGWNTNQPEWVGYPASELKATPNEAVDTFTSQIDNANQQTLIDQWTNRSSEQAQGVANPGPLDTFLNYGDDVNRQAQGYADPGPVDSFFDLMGDLTYPEENDLNALYIPFPITERNFLESALTLQRQNNSPIANVGRYDSLIDIQDHLSKQNESLSLFNEIDNALESINKEQEIDNLKQEIALHEYVLNNNNSLPPETTQNLRQQLADLNQQLSNIYERTNLPTNESQSEAPVTNASSSPTSGMEANPERPVSSMPSTDPNTDQAVSRPTESRGDGRQSPQVPRENAPNTPDSTTEGTSPRERQQGSTGETGQPDTQAATSTGSSEPETGTGTEYAGNDTDASGAKGPNIETIKPNNITSDDLNIIRYADNTNVLNFLGVTDKVMSSILKKFKMDPNLDNHSLGKLTRDMLLLEKINNDFTLRNKKLMSGIKRQNSRIGKLLDPYYSKLDKIKFNIQSKSHKYLHMDKDSSITDELIYNQFGFNQNAESLIPVKNTVESLNQEMYKQLLDEQILYANEEKSFDPNNQYCE